MKEMAAITEAIDMYLKNGIFDGDLLRIKVM